MSSLHPDEDAPDINCETPPLTALVGKPVRLIPMLREHTEELYQSLGGPENDGIWNNNAGWPYHDLESFAKDLEPIFKATERADAVPFSVQVIKTNRIEGYSGFHKMSTANRVLEFSVVYSRRIQRTTAATEGFYLAAAHAFAHGFRRFEWRCGPRNIASQRAAIRFGMTQEGMLRQNLIVNGKLRDTLILSILDFEWPRMKSAMEAWLDESNFDEEGQQKRTLSGFVQ